MIQPIYSTLLITYLFRSNNTTMSGLFLSWTTGADDQSVSWRAQRRFEHTTQLSRKLQRLRAFSTNSRWQYERCRLSRCGTSRISKASSTEISTKPLRRKPIDFCSNLICAPWSRDKSLLLNIRAACVAQQLQNTTAYRNILQGLAMVDPFLEESNAYITGAKSDLAA